jgi:NAD(P)H-hydrate epimerase
VENLPAWLTPLPDADSMRAVDRWAIEERGTDGVELMERAGAGTAAWLERLEPDGPVTVVCGKGNNGGDGLVVARLLRLAGRPVTVVCLASPDDFKGDARVNLLRLPGPGPVDLDGRPWAEPDGAVQADPLSSPAAVVDAILGTGFAGEPRGEAARAIDLINDCGASVVSVDVPSGVDASSGEISGAAVFAAATVTFHAPKPGLWIHPGKAHAGNVHVLDIGIPRGAPRDAAAGLISDQAGSLIPRRGAASTKFSSGHVLVAGGSRGLTGAPALAGRAAMRAGAGYVTVCVPNAVQAVVQSAGTPELMVTGLAESGGSLAPDALEDILAACERSGALALGPGFGRTDEAGELARALALQAQLPLLLDADGLGAHAGRLAELSQRSAPTVLTPHAGELGRLLGVGSEEIDRRRLHHARAAAAEAGAIVVLKGDDTIVAHPSGLAAISRGGSPGLATAGTGDVLSGVIAALLSQGVEPLAAASAGVWLHSRAGRLAAQRVGAAEGVIASDVIESLPAARAPS